MIRKNQRLRMSSTAWPGSRISSAQIGANTWTLSPTSTPVNRGSATPTIWKGCPSSEIERPMALGSPP
jgi:hypothetical protein